MNRRNAGALLLVIAMALSAASVHAACEPTDSCRRCAADNEMRWNPDERFISDRLKRFYRLDDLMTAAYGRGDHTGAARLANEYLELAAVYRCNWNHGNAIHDANRILGHIRLKQDDVEGASAFLLRAGKSTGSPQLDTFGPDLDLADALLRRGAVEPVKAYLRDIQRFWRMNDGQVERWIDRIEKGERPALDRFGTQPGIAMSIIYWTLWAWPPLVVLGFFLPLGRDGRKWAAAGVALVAAYAAMRGAEWAFAELMPIAMAHLSHPASFILVMAAGVGAIFLLPTAIAFALSRRFAAGERRRAATA